MPVINGSTVTFHQIDDQIFVYGPDSGQFGTATYSIEEGTAAAEDLDYRVEFYKKQGIYLTVRVKDGK